MAGNTLPRGYGSAYEEAFADIVGGREFTQAETQQAQADYHALVSWLDAQVVGTSRTTMLSLIATGTPVRASSGSPAAIFASSRRASSRARSLQRVMNA